MTRVRVRLRSFVHRATALLAGAGAAAACACACDPSRPFEREAPPVREAIGHLDGGDAQTAVATLEEYLGTGVCESGSIGTPPRVRERPNGTFDLGLGMFKIAEAFGRRFGDEEADHEPDPTLKGLRAGQVECALRVVRAVGDDGKQPSDLRARARYLEGNLLFLNGSYEEAVHAYDQALELVPGMHDGGAIGASDAGRSAEVDPLGRHAAFNRAIALRRIEDKKDAGKDAEPPDASPDGGKGDSGAQGDSGKNDKDQDSGGNDNRGDDAGQDSGGGDDGGSPPPPPKPEPDSGAPPPPSRQSQDERMLDQLENAPTVQQETAKKQAQRRRVRGMADK